MIYVLQHGFALLWLLPWIYFYGISHLFYVRRHIKSKSVGDTGSLMTVIYCTPLLLFGVFMRWIPQMGVMIANYFVAEPTSGDTEAVWGCLGAAELAGITEGVPVEVAEEFEGVESEVVEEMLVCEANLMEPECLGMEGCAWGEIIPAVDAVEAKLPINHSTVIYIFMAGLFITWDLIFLWNLFYKKFWAIYRGLGEEWEYIKFATSAQSWAAYCFCRKVNLSDDDMVGINMGDFTTMTMQYAKTADNMTTMNGRKMEDLDIREYEVDGKNMLMSAANTVTS